MLRESIQAMAALARVTRSLLQASLRRGGETRSERNLRSVDPVLCSIGYEAHRTPDTLVRALADAGVERLVDVRELPLSRRRGFSKSALADYLAEAGIAYEHRRGLGNPKPYRELYRSGQQASGERLYRAHLRAYGQAELEGLARTVEEGTTCVLCFEAAHQECHRSVIVQALRERMPKVSVQHL